MVFPTGHAVGLKREDGLEILIHIGIETVNLQGRGFQIHCKEKQRVNCHEKLITFDKELLQRESLDPTVMIVFPNASDFRLQIKDDKGDITIEDVIANAEKKK